MGSPIMETPLAPPSTTTAVATTANDALDCESSQICPSANPHVFNRSYSSSNCTPPTTATAISSKKRRCVTFCDENQVHTIDAAHAYPAEHKAELWMTKADLVATVQGFPVCIKECVAQHSQETVDYTRSLVECYLACTPATEEETVDTSEVRQYLQALSSVGEAPLSLRGLEGHLFADMTRERMRRRAEHVTSVCAATKQNDDRSVMMFSAKSSAASQRFAAVIGAADALAAAELYRSDPRILDELKWMIPASSKCTKVPQSYACYATPATAAGRHSFTVPYEQLRT